MSATTSVSEHRHCPSPLPTRDNLYAGEGISFKHSIVQNISRQSDGLYLRTNELRQVHVGIKHAARSRALPCIYALSNNCSKIVSYSVRKPSDPIELSQKAICV